MAAREESTAPERGRGRDGEGMDETVGLRSGDVGWQLGGAGQKQRAGEMHKKKKGEVVGGRSLVFILM